MLPAISSFSKMFKSMIISYFLIQTFISTSAKCSSNDEQIYETTNGHKSIKNYTTKTKNPEHYGLTNEIVYPKSYILNMVPDLKKLTFSGQVDITIYIKFSTNVINLNSKDLTIKQCLIRKGLKMVDIACTLDPSNERLQIKADKKFQIDTEYVLTIKFEADLRSDMSGFYKTSYFHNGIKRWAAVTHFEPTHARKAFPCFDKPKYKTPFTISIARHTTQTAVSNMPPQNISQPDPLIENRVWVKFHQTVPLPTYLVSFMVSKFAHKNDSSNFLKVYARKDVINHTSYALNQSQKIIASLKSFLSIDPLVTKLDLIAVPDFSGGAMENWGMMTYRERNIIGSESMASQFQKFLISSVISHECSHQWFGNLVTPERWAYLWMKEGFARYFEYFNVHAVEPSWNVDQLFVIQVVQPALWKEVGIHQAMTTKIGKHLRHDSLYGVINYDKSASIIRMFEHIMKPNRFRRAINRYLTDSYKNHGGVVTPSNLFEAFETQAGQDSLLKLPPPLLITKMMKSWTENIGYPVIKVYRNRKQNQVRFEQSTYKSWRTAIGPPNHQKWIVPITYATKSNAIFSNLQPSLWSLADKPSVISNISDDDWVLCNLNQSAYHRVNYDSYGWKLLINQLKENANKIPTLNRAQLLDDSLVLASDGSIPTKTAYELLAYLKKETEIIPWISAVTHLESTYETYLHTKSFSKIKLFIEKLMGIAYKIFGFHIQSTDSAIEKTGKPLILRFACLIGHRDCILKSLNEYQKNVNDINKVQPDLKPTVFCNALRHGANPLKIYDNLWTTYSKTNIAFDANTILTSLKCATDEQVIKKILRKITNPNYDEIRKQDQLYLTNSFFKSPQSVTTAIQSLYDKIPIARKLGKADLATWKSLLWRISNYVTTEEHVKLLRNFERKLIAIDQTNFDGLINVTRNIGNKSQKVVELMEKKAGDLFNFNTSFLL